jgi:hypothetical protein
VESILSFRLLSPIGDISDEGVNSITVYPKTLKINIIEDIEDLESAVAVRDVNNSLEKDYTISITCSVDSAVKNSFGISKKISNRFMRLDTSLAADFEVPQSYLPNILIDVNLRRWPIPKWIQDYVFIVGFQSALYMEQSDGKTIAYGALYTANIDGQPYMAVYTGFNVQAGNPSARPTLPKGYKALPAVTSEDKVMMMLSFFESENALQRAGWKLYGFPDSSAATYAQTVAKGCHAVRPDVCFRVDATALRCIWPGQLAVLPYKGENKKFIGTRLTVDLTAGKTDITMMEAKLQNLTDITYE